MLQIADLRRLTSTGSNACCSLTQVANLEENADFLLLRRQTLQLLLHLSTKFLRSSHCCSARAQISLLQTLVQTQSVFATGRPEGSWGYPSEIMKLDELIAQGVP